MIAAAPTSSATDISTFSAHAHFANLSLRSKLADIQDAVKPLPDATAFNLAPIADTATKLGPESRKEEFNVGIVGAGVAGLFTAMIFDHLRERFDLKVNYEILESRDRVGGRLFTYHFEQRPGMDDPPVAEHEYYDVGAMRFPAIEIMRRTFQLFQTLQMKTRYEKNPDDVKKAQLGDLIPYFLQAPNTPLRYNDVTLVPKLPPRTPVDDPDWEGGPQLKTEKTEEMVVSEDEKPEVTAAAFKIPGLPQEVMNLSAGQMIEDEIDVYTNAYNPKKPGVFWKMLMKLGDHYSVRQYLRSQEFKYNTIEFLETLNFGNRWYDQAFSEMVLEALDFDSKTNWYCVYGGSSLIAKKMEEALALKGHGKILTEKKVVAMEYVYPPKKAEAGPRGQPTAVKVTYRDTPTTRAASQRKEVKESNADSEKIYDAVFNSAPLGAQQHMKLEGLELEYGVKSAIRSLGYGASCKVGIRFKDLWWISKYGIKGGVSKTDAPLRCCVYPSYNLNPDKAPLDKPGVLLASYTWSQEAERIGSLITPNSPEGEEQLKDVLLDDLARLHTKTEEEYKALLAELHNKYITHHAYNWYSDPNSVGAFAFFGPGQFKNMWPSLIASSGKHMIIGEAASAHHAWVVGSLESAVRGVYQFLNLHKDLNENAMKAYEAYRNDKIEGPFGPLPAEFNRTDEVKTTEKQGNLKVIDPSLVNASAPSPVGDLLRQQALFEEIRLKQGKDVLQTSTINKDDIKPILQGLKTIGLAPEHVV